MARISQALAFAAAKRSPFVEELRQLVRFPSVSAQRRHAQDVKRSAAWLADHRRGIGLDGVQVVATNGLPLVSAFRRVGGSLPIVNSFKEILGIPTVITGFALPSDRLHGPKEKSHLPNFFNGIATSISFLDQLAKAPRRAGGAGLVERERAGSLR